MVLADLIEYKKYFSSATYSMADDKIRLYYTARFPSELWECLTKVITLTYAPKQGCMVGTWSPAREDIAIALCDEIEEDDITPAERAEAKAERLENYAKNASARATSEKKNLDHITNGIPFGQPILVGHHSQRRAERDAERIEMTMGRIVKNLELSDHWKDRAEGVIRHQQYLETPAVIYRRIQTLEADLRSHEREIVKFDTDWAKYSWISKNASRDIVLTPEQTESMNTDVQASRDRNERFHQRWISHLTNRLIYQRVLYENSGGMKVDTQVIEIGGAVHYMGDWLEITRVTKRDDRITSVTCKPAARHAHWLKKQKVDYSDIRESMTKEQYTAHLAGEPTEQNQQVIEDKIEKLEKLSDVNRQRSETQKEIEAFSDPVITVVSADELFPTPPIIIYKMIHLAELDDPNLEILEPSAGTGVIIDAILETNPDALVYACEINDQLREGLTKKAKVLAADFLLFEGPERFHRIIMNPPFSKEIAHVQHAYDLLSPGGILITIMSEGPFFRSYKADTEFRTWLNAKNYLTQALPPGSFSRSGTEVNTRIVKITKYSKNNGSQNFLF